MLPFHLSVGCSTVVIAYLLPATHKSGRILLVGGMMLSATRVIRHASRCLQEGSA